MNDRDNLTKLLRDNRTRWATDAEHRESQAAQADAIIADGYTNRPVALPDRDDLARELYVRDNARQGRNKSTAEFVLLGPDTYAHYLADAALEAFKQANP